MREVTEGVEPEDKWLLIQVRSSFRYR
jgi:hypothetical protein